MGVNGLLSYVLLVGSVAFFAIMSALIIHHSRKEAKKIQEKERGNSQETFDFGFD
jgi:hypothetical protein